MVQVGREPDDWKPMTSVGSGASEIRVRDRSGQYRVIYKIDEREVIGEARGQELLKSFFKERR